MRTTSGLRCEVLTHAPFAKRRKRFRRCFHCFHTNERSPRRSHDSRLCSTEPWKSLPWAAGHKDFCRRASCNRRLLPPDFSTLSFPTGRRTGAVTEPSQGRAAFCAFHRSEAKTLDVAPVLHNLAAEKWGGSDFCPCFHVTIQQLFSVSHSFATAIVASTKVATQQPN